MVVPQARQAKRTYSAASGVSLSPIIAEEQSGHGRGYRVLWLRFISAVPQPRMPEAAAWVLIWIKAGRAAAVAHLLDAFSACLGGAYG